MLHKMVGLADTFGMLLYVSLRNALVDGFHGVVMVVI